MTAQQRRDAILDILSQASGPVSAAALAGRFGGSFSGESHNFWELLYVDKGDIQVTAGEQTCRLRRGQLTGPAGL